MRGVVFLRSFACIWHSYPCWKEALYREGTRAIRTVRGRDGMHENRPVRGLQNNHHRIRFSHQRNTWPGSVIRSQFLLVAGYELHLSYHFPWVCSASAFRFRFCHLSPLSLFPPFFFSFSIKLDFLRSFPIFAGELCLFLV